MNTYRRAMQVSLPTDTFERLVAEAGRRQRPLGEVVRDLLMVHLPDYLAREVRRALAPPLEVEVRFRQSGRAELVEAESSPTQQKGLTNVV